MAKEKIDYTQALDTIYQNREQDLSSRIDNYRKNITSIKQYQEEMAERQRQFNQEMAYQKQKDSQQTYSYSDSGSDYSNSSNDSFGNSQATMNKSDYYFKSTTGADYQPRYINNTKLTKSGLKLSNIGTIKGVSGSKNVWEANGRYYVWDEDTYIDVTTLYKSSTATKSGSGKSFK